MRSEEIYNEWFETYGAWVELDGKINATPNEIRHLASLAYSAGVRDAAERATAERDFAIGLERAKGERDDVLHARGSTAAVILADILSLLGGKGAGK